MTAFGPITIKDLTVGTGGGFSVSNAVYGSFVASSGSIVTQTSSFLNFTLFGIYTPRQGIFRFHGISGEGRYKLRRTGSSLSGSFTLAEVPEPGALALWGSGILVGWRGLRWQRKI